MTTPAKRLLQILEGWSSTHAQWDARDVRNGDRTKYEETWQAFEMARRVEASLLAASAAHERSVDHYLTTLDPLWDVIMGVSPAWQQTWQLDAQLRKDLLSIDDFLDSRWPEQPLTDADQLDAALSELYELLLDATIEPGLKQYITALLNEARVALRDIGQVGPNFVRECAFKVNGAVLQIFSEIPDAKKTEARGIVAKIAYSVGWAFQQGAQAAIQGAVKAAIEG